VDLQVDSPFLDKLAYNFTIGNITNKLSGIRCTTIDGISSNSIGINE